MENHPSEWHSASDRLARFYAEFFVDTSIFFLDSDMHSLEPIFTCEWMNNETD